MKRAILLLTILAFTAAAFAQPGDARFDADLKRLTRRFENVESIKRLPVDKNTEVRLKGAIQSAENELGRFKEKYPNHDVTSFERDLANFKNPQASSISGGDSESTGSSSTSSFANVEDFVAAIEMILDFRSDPRPFLQKDPKALSDAKQQITDFSGKMDQLLTSEFLELAKDQSNRKISRISEKASREAKTLNTKLSQTDSERISEEDDENAMLMRYFDIVFSQKKQKVLNTIFAGDADIAAAKQSADSLIAKLGTIDEIEKRGKANYAAKVAKNRMYPERQNNAALRNLAINAFNSSVYRKADDGITVLKAHLVSGGWSVERNEITGVILSRDQQVHIAFKAKDGKCYTYLMRFQQKHLGGGKYGGGLDRSGSTSEILCENVPK